MTNFTGSEVIGEFVGELLVRRTSNVRYGYRSGSH